MTHKNQLTFTAYYTWCNMKQKSWITHSNCCVKQIRKWRWRQSRREWIPETSWRDSWRQRHCFQRKLLLHCSRWCRFDCELGCRWERIPAHWRPFAHSSTHARTCRQTFGWLESCWSPRISPSPFIELNSVSNMLCEVFSDVFLKNGLLTNSSCLHLIL